MIDTVDLLRSDMAVVNEATLRTVEQIGQTLTALSEALTEITTELATLRGRVGRMESLVYGDNAGG
jgi:hypothetical protein